jgi:hypothetical protein
MGFRVLLSTHYLIREILMEIIFDVHATGVRIKKIINLGVVTIYFLQKGFRKKYLCWYADEELYVPYDTMVERMVGSTSSARVISMLLPLLW